MQTRISVLMPCRNAAAHLPAAIASLESQTFGDFEVIAINDHSEDDTAAILRSWAARDTRVLPLESSGRGIVAALACGLAAARAPLVARMDADDIAHSRRFEAQHAFMKQNPIAGCGTGVRYFPEEEVRDGARRYQAWLNEVVRPDEIARDIFIECPIAHPTLMVRRSILLALGGYRDMAWPEDYDLALRLWAAGHALAKLPEVLYDWREGAGRLSRWHPNYFPDAFRRCKVHFLKQTLLRAKDGAIVWGAGPVGKSFARELVSQNVKVRAFVDIDPRKIGQRLGGAEVIAPADIERFRGALCLAAVGAPGARALIREALRARGWNEMDDFCVVA